MNELYLPQELRSLVARKHYAVDDVGMSASKVLIFDDMVLKIQPERQETRTEKRMLSWLDGKLPVPKLVYHTVEEGINYLLMSRIKGKMACDAELMENPGQLVPILAECVLVAIVTFLVCFYFGQRFGGSNDFERTLGLYGTSTGTVPTGIALVRIVDPNFKTNTAVELGLTNLIMMASTPVVIVMMLYAQGDLSENLTMIGLAVCTVLYLVILKVTKCWGKKSFSWKK